MTPADAWTAFQAASDAPTSARATFLRVVGTVDAAITPPLPYVHGDPRVDRWETATSGDHPPVRERPDGFEPLAAWSFAAVHPTGGNVWERPLRHCATPPVTEEGALARLLTAWDEWPDFRGPFANLLADITTDLQHHGLATGGELTEAARAIIARAGERGQP